ncbi:MAG: protein kinase [bacterium]|nr:protein kinase [bacterium]
MIGETVAHYKILDKLGTGGMGIVYLAHDGKLNREVALKFLPESTSVSNDDRERFLQEARAAAGMNHPNVCTIYSIEEFENRDFIVMEYVEGETLSDKISGSPLDLKVIADYAIQIGDALQAAHEKEVVHRDVKPSNIMITKDGRVKVMDFGLAKLKGSLKLTKTSSTVGTLAYMAPEQIQSAPVDARSDIFSFGVVLFEMLTGKLPFRGEYESAMMYSILNEEPINVQEFRPDVPREYSDIVSKALEKEPDLRYQVVKGILADLKRLKRETSRILKPSAVEPPEDQQKTDGKTDDSSEIQEPQEKNPRKLFPLFAVIGILAIIIAAAIFWFKAEKPAAAENIVTVTVFENQTGDPELDQIGSMVAELITQGVGNIETIPVIPVTRLDEKDKNLTGMELVKRSAEITGATTIVTGSYFKQGDDITIIAQISDAEEEKVLSSLEPVNGNAVDPVQAIDEIRQQVMGELVYLLDPEYKDWKNTMNNPPRYDAWKLLDTGNELFSLRRYREAAAYFSRAFKLDNSFYVSLLREAVANLNSGQHYKVDSLVNIVKPHREKLSSYNNLYLDLQFARLEGNLIKCYEISKSTSELSLRKFDNYNVGLYAYRINDPVEAVDAFSREDTTAQFFKNWFAYWSRYGIALHMKGDHETELLIAEKACRLFNGQIRALNLKIYALAAMGRIEELDAALQESYSWTAAGGSPAGSYKRAAWTLWAKGYKEKAREYGEKAIEFYRSLTQEQVLSYNLRGAIFEGLFLSVAWDDGTPSQTDQDNIPQNIPLTPVREERLAMMGELSESVLRDNPTSMLAHLNRGFYYALSGDVEGAREMYDWLGNLDRPYTRGRNIYYQAMIASVLNEKEQAVNLLRSAFRNGEAYGLGQLYFPEFENLRDYPPFIEFMKPRK